MYVENQPNVLFAGLGAMDQSDYEVMAGLGQMDLSDYQISLGAQRGKRLLPGSFSQPVALSVGDLPNPAFIGGLGQYRVPGSVRKIRRPVKVNFKYGVPSVAGFGAEGVDTGTAVAIGTAGLVISAIVSFGIMTLASYVGARWAGCRRS